MKRIFLFTTILFLSIFATAQTVNYKALHHYLTKNSQNPTSYVISKFKNHDFVFIGENHRIQHDVLFVTSLIPKLYKNGIYNLAIEFGDHQYQKQIDSLVTAKDWNEEFYYSLHGNSFFVTWGYKEYLDIAKVVWGFNRKLNDKKKFRLILLGYNYEPCKTGLDKFGGTDPDLQMANNLDEEVCKRKEKVLVYSGIHHAFTHYKQPIYDNQKNKFIRFVDTRMGNVIAARYPGKTFTIFLHAPWISKDGFDKPMIKPAGGVIDSLMKLNADEPVGFDLLKAPIGAVKITDTYYMYGYNDFSLQDIYDGYIFLKPLSQYKNVTVAKGFYENERLENFKNFLRCLKTIPEENIMKIDTEEAEKSVFQDGNVKRLYGNLIQ